MSVSHKMNFEMWISMTLMNYHIWPLGVAAVKGQLHYEREKQINYFNVYWQIFKPRMMSA